MLYPIESKHGWGFIDKEGQIIIDPFYDWASSFREGMAAVEKDGRYGFINTEGTLVIDFLFSNVDDFHDGLARVSSRVNKNTVKCYVDKSGKTITPAVKEIKEQNRFSEGRAAIKINNLWGFIDRSGELIIEPLFQKVDWFVKGRALICEDEKFGFIDKKGHIIIEPQFSYAYSFTHDGLAAVAQGVEYNDGVILNQSGQWGFINTEGRVVIDMKFNEADPFSEGMAAVKRTNSEGTGFIDKRGRMIIPPIYDMCYHFKEGLAAVQKDDLWGFIDFTGRTTINLQFEEVDLFSEGIALVNSADYINQKGNYIWRENMTTSSTGNEGELQKDKKSHSPEDAFIMLAAEYNMNTSEFIDYLKEQATGKGLFKEGDEWLDEMPETDILEWILTEGILDE